MLVAAGKVPEHLRAIAGARIANELKLLIDPGSDEPALDEEKLRMNHQLNLWLLTQMVAQVAAPECESDENGIPTKWEDAGLTPELVEQYVPAEDQELLIALAERMRDTDARGVVMGVMPLSRLARFRAAHGCGEDCAACESIRNEGLARLPVGLGAV
jgi:hypothetical protein